jgi:AAA ATPase domain/Bacterial regulatory proteins, luxR family
VASVRAGQCQVLVVRGEAGIGKTALLDYAAERADRFRTVRASGIDSEMELAFAALHQICMPLIDGIERLPPPQRDALGTAFGLSSGSQPDPFLVGLATLTLVSDATEARPFMCLVDDAQWLDRSSAQVLSFVARRLQAESVFLLFGERDQDEPDELTGLPELRLQRLSYADARDLFASLSIGPRDEQVRDRILAEARGNPLALLELTRTLSSTGLADDLAIPGGLPARIEASFRRQVAQLPAETQRLLLVAAAEPIGDPTLLWRAATELGIAFEAAAPAEVDGLLEVGSRVTFRHPLLRSAVYRAADPQARRSAHGALAGATNPDFDPDRRAWHRANAALAPDEEVAGELERSAGRAQSRGGVTAAAAFLERATELTPDPARRGARALAAAEAEFEAAAPETALELTATAELCPLDRLQRARLERLRAELAFARGRPTEAPSLLLDAARRLEPFDAGLARETYLEALGADIFAGRFGGGQDVREAAKTACAAPAGPEPPRSLDLLLDGLAVRFTDGYVAGVAPLTRAVRAFVQERGRSEEDLRWMWLAWLVAYEVWDDETWHQLTSRLVEFARNAGALAVLPLALIFRSQVHVQAGEFAAASAVLEEADAIKAVTGNTPLMHTSNSSSGSLVFTAWRGRETQTLELIEASIEDATVRGEGRTISVVENAKAVLYNGLGQYEAAFAAAQLACEHDDLGLFAWGLVELVEAGVRSGNFDVAVAAGGRLEERTRANGTDWALGIEARCRALLSEGEGAECLYREAIERLARTRIRVALARARLLYGEWLRRENRRVDGRNQLRTAYEMFADFGMEAFAERARRELLATGETVRKRTVDTRNDLTAQETQIARFAADGHTNPEIGARLFISPRTVEWHLRKIFTKLGISSRKELGGALPDAGGPSRLRP